MYTFTILAKLGLTTTLLASIFYLYQWQCPGIISHVIPTNVQEWRTMIHHNPKCQHKILHSIDHAFDLFYVENIQCGDPYAFAPYFPAIEISTESNHDAWVQIVRTDSDNPNLKIFIDAHPQNYPFYVKEQTFYDIPSWNYTFFTKPLKAWLAHTYAIELDEQYKTIKCIGGISWGFQFNLFSFQPTMILPTALTKDNWNIDWKIYQNALPDYETI